MKKLTKLRSRPRARNIAQLITRQPLESHAHPLSGPERHCQEKVRPGSCGILQPELIESAHLVAVGRGSLHDLIPAKHHLSALPLLSFRRKPVCLLAFGQSP